MEPIIITLFENSVKTQLSQYVRTCFVFHRLLSSKTICAHSCLHAGADIPLEVAAVDTPAYTCTWSQKISHNNNKKHQKTIPAEDLAFFSFYHPLSLSLSL
jgi:hypothetical protein